MPLSSISVSEPDWDALRAEINRLTLELNTENARSYVREWTWEPTLTKKKTVEEKIKEMEQRFLTRNDPRPDPSW